MITIDTLRSYRPETLTTVANALQKREQQITDLQDEFNAGKPPEGWSDMYGSAPALRKWESLRDRLNDRMAEVTRARGELDVAAEELKGAKKDLERWMNVASEQRFTVTESGDEVASAITSDDAEGIDKTTIRIMENLQGSEAYTKELFTEVSPDEFGDAVKDLSDAAFPTNGAQTVGDSRDIYKSFLTAAGVSLATYTKAEGEYAPPADFANTFASEIKDEDNPENAAALTMLVRAGGAEASFEPKFLADVTDNIYEWERSQEGGVWGERGQDILDPFGDVESKSDAKTGIVTYTSGFANDGLANLMGGMRNTPVAAQDFFADSNGVDKDKLEYLMLERTFSGEKGSDEGDGLGLALEAAAIGDASADDKVPGTELSRRDFAGAFATDVFQMVADNSGIEDTDDLGTNIDRDDRPFDGDSDKAWHPWSKMTDSLGAIGAGYADDIYDEMSEGNRGTDARMDISEPDLIRVLNEIGSSDDQTGTQTLMAGVAKAGIEQEVGGLVAGWKEDHPNGTIQDFMKSGPNIDGSNLGETMGKIVNASDDAWADDQKTEAVRRQYIAKAFEMGTAYLPSASALLPEGSTGAAAAGVAQGQAISQMKEAITAQGNPSTWTAEQRVDLPKSLSYAIGNEFLQAGMLGEQPNPQREPDPYPGVPNAAEGRPGPITDIGPDGKIIFDRDLWFDRNEQANDDWLTWQNSQPEADLSETTDEVKNGLDDALNDEPAGR